MHMHMMKPQARVCQCKKARKILRQAFPNASERTLHMRQSVLGTWYLVEYIVPISIQRRSNSPPLLLLYSYICRARTRASGSLQQILNIHITHLLISFLL